jgi:hypothetical protein
MYQNKVLFSKIQHNIHEPVLRNNPLQPIKLGDRQSYANALAISRKALAEVDSG